MSEEPRGTGDPDRPAGHASGPPAGYASAPPAGYAGAPPGAYAGAVSGPTRRYAGPPPAGVGWRRPARVEPLPGTPFALAYLDVPPVTSGMAVGGLVAGIAALVVMVVVACFGLAGAQDGWGALVGGAFAVPAGLLGAGAIGLGVLGQRQIRRAAPARITGRGMAVAAIACGASAVALTLVALGAAVLLMV